MNAIRKVYQYAEPNLTLVGWMGFVGFPVVTIQPRDLDTKFM